jgi:hypothetical protein
LKGERVVIIRILELVTTNENGVKIASVRATEGPEAASETFTFTIIDQNVSVTVDFAALETKVVQAPHTASGKGFVIVTSQSSGLARHCFLDVDAPASTC